MQRYRLSEQNTSSDKLFGRRRLFFCAVFYLIGSLAAAELDISVPLCFAFGALFLLLFILFCKRPYAFAAMLAAMVFVGIAVTSACFDSIDSDIDRVKRSAVQGIVVDVSSTESGTAKYKLRDAAAGGEELDHCVFVYADEDDYVLGDKIRAYGEVRQPSRKSYEFDFDARLYHVSEDVSLVMYAYHTEKKEACANIVQKIRNFVGEKIDVLFSEQSATAKAMLIGMDEDIDRALMSAYREARISHILCISGLHVSVIIAAVSFLLKKLRSGRLSIYIITVIFLIGYTLLAGASESIVRAAVLNLILLTAQMINRRGDMLTALSVGFFVCVIMQPLCIFGTGFQLSFGCVFTLICMADVFGENKIISAVGSAVCGLAATTVILWNINHEIVPLSVLFNIIAVPIASVVLIVLLISLLIFLAFGCAFPQIGIPGRFLIEVMDGIAGLSEKLSWEIPVKSIHPIAVICVFAAIFFASKYLIAPRGVKLGCFAAMISVFAALLIVPADLPMLQIDILAHEYTDTVVIRDNMGGCVLIDAGNPYGGDYLAAYGIGAEAVFLSGESLRSISGAEQYPDAEFIAPADVRNGDVFRLNDLVSVTALKGADEAHADYLITCCGENILLYMGRSPQDIEYPTAKVLKLSSDGKKNLAFAGNSGAEYVILRETTEQIAAISTQKAGVVTVSWDGQLKVESEYDGRTISESTEY